MILLIQFTFKSKLEYNEQVGNHTTIKIGNVNTSNI